MISDNPQTIGACTVVVNSKQEILLGKRKNSFRAGFWGIPGGRIELMEPIETTAKRELEEETGLIANRLDYLGVIREFQPDHSVPYNFIHFAFVCRKYTGQPELVEPDKCGGWQWFDPNNLPPKLLRGHSAAIELFQHPAMKFIDYPS